jgi:hypothetical protein
MPKLETDMTNINEDDIRSQYDLIYENTSKKLDQQISNLNAIDAKASTLLAVVGVLILGAFQLLTSKAIDPNDRLILIVLEFTLLSLSGFFTFRAIILNRKEGWRDDPRPEKLLEVFSKNADKGVYWLKDQIIKSISVSYEANDILVIKKYGYLLKARFCLFLGVIALFINLVFILFPTLSIILNIRI